MNHVTRTFVSLFTLAIFFENGSFAMAHREVTRADFGSTPRMTDKEWHKKHMATLRKRKADLRQAIDVVERQYSAVTPAPVKTLTALQGIAIVARLDKANTELEEEKRKARIKWQSEVTRPNFVQPPWMPGLDRTRILGFDRERHEKTTEFARKVQAVSNLRYVAQMESSELKNMREVFRGDKTTLQKIEFIDAVNKANVAPLKENEKAKAIALWKDAKRGTAIVLKIILRKLVFKTPTPLIILKAVLFDAEEVGNSHMYERQSDGTIRWIHHGPREPHRPERSNGSERGTGRESGGTNRGSGNGGSNRGGGNNPRQENTSPGGNERPGSGPGRDPAGPADLIS